MYQQLSISSGISKESQSLDMDHSRYLIDLLQKAEFKAKMSLYYLKESGENDKKQEEILSKQTNFNDINDANDINDLYNSSQMYCKNLEKQLNDKNGEIRKIQLGSEEISRHNEAMLEEINHLNNRLEMYPKTIKDLKAEIEKLSEKVGKLEAQKKFMEQQALQNEARLQQSHSVQQDLHQSHIYINRLKKYLDSSSTMGTGSPPVLLLDKTSQTTSTGSTDNQGQVQSALKDQSQTIRELRSDLIGLRRSCSEFTALNDDLEKLRDLFQSNSGSADESLHENCLHENGVQQSVDQPEDETTPIPIQFLLNVERVEVLGRVLPPDSDLTLTTYTNNTNNTDVIVNDNNLVSTFSLDLVIPMNAPQQQLTWFVTRICQRIKEQRSVMIVMLGENDLTMYGTPQCHGLLRHLVKSLLSMKKTEELLTLSVGTFVNNQMCDGLSEFSMQDGKVTAVPITTLDLGIELLSQADIPDEVEQVLHQFTIRNSDASTGSVSILECDSMDGDSSEILHQYRACGKVSPGSRPNVLYDTVNAYTEKGGAVTVFLNLKPDIQSTANSHRLLKYASQITGVEPVTQNRKRGIFSFRS